MDGESNENIYRKFGMSSKGEGMSCGVVEEMHELEGEWRKHTRVGRSAVLVITGKGRKKERKKERELKKNF